MHGLYKRFLLFCAVFVALIFAVVGFWLLLGVTCSCAVLVLAASWVLLGWGVTVCAIRFGEWLRG